MTFYELHRSSEWVSTFILPEGMPARGDNGVFEYLMAYRTTRHNEDPGLLSAIDIYNAARAYHSKPSGSSS